MVAGFFFFCSQVRVTLQWPLWHVGGYNELRRVHYRFFDSTKLCRLNDRMTVLLREAGWKIYLDNNPGKPVFPVFSCSKLYFLVKRHPFCSNVPHLAETEDVNSRTGAERREKITERARCTSFTAIFCRLIRWNDYPVHFRIDLLSP